MTRSIVTAKSELHQALQHAKIAKAIIKAHVEAARLLMDEDSLKELKDVALQLGTDIATIEGSLAQFGRVAFGTNRFEVKQKAVVA